MKRPSTPPDAVTGEPTAFFWWEDDTLVVNILGKPNASRDVIGKPKGTQLQVSVTAAPPPGAGDGSHGALSRR